WLQAQRQGRPVSVCLTSANLQYLDNTVDFDTTQDSYLFRGLRAIKPVTGPDINRSQHALANRPRCIYTSRCVLLLLLIYWRMRRRRRSIKHDPHANEVSPPAVPGYEKPELQGTGICELADAQLPELNPEQVHEAYGGPTTAELHPTHLLEMDASNIPELDSIGTSIERAGGRTESVPGLDESPSKPRQKPLPGTPSTTNDCPRFYKLRTPG
ncbi:MAG: hypothetical protein Q9226_009105, partial [Calogaya cf. arnoldii]